MERPSPSSCPSLFSERLRRAASRPPGTSGYAGARALHRRQAPPPPLPHLCAGAAARSRSNLASSGPSRGRDRRSIGAPIGRDGGDGGDGRRRGAHDRGTACVVWGWERTRSAAWGCAGDLGGAPLLGLPLLMGQLRWRRVRCDGLCCLLGGAREHRPAIVCIHKSAIVVARSAQHDHLNIVVHLSFGCVPTTCPCISTSTPLSSPIGVVVHLELRLHNPIGLVVGSVRRECYELHTLARLLRCSAH